MKNSVKTIATTFTFLITILTAHANFAQTATPTASTPASEAKEMTEGEIRKVDADNQKITIKHGFIKNLDMPGMTMVFVAREKVLLDGLSAGDKVQFAVEMVNGKFTVTDIKKSAP